MDRTPESSVPNRLVGFDLRYSAEKWIHQWDPQRRQRFLLRPEIDVPLSIDPNCWPGPNPATTHWSLFISELAVISSLRSTQTAALDMLAVALTGEVDMNDLPMFDFQTKPGWIAADWQNLGWDVADLSLTSGLFNCGLEPQVTDQLRREWRHDLNGHGLFADAHRALAFCTVMDRLVPEHAPFYAFQLFLIPG